MQINNLPKKIAVFPLSGAIFFPKTILPLNIFEKKYIELVNDSMKDQRLFGMIQPKSKTQMNKDVYKVGCLGKIVNFTETDDKRFIINLAGIIRFRVIEELSTSKLYRKFEVDYSNFFEDLKENKKKDEINSQKKIFNKIKTYLERKDIYIEYNELKKLNLDQLLSTVSMISPFSVEEKQKLIETVKIEDKLSVLEEILNFNSSYIVENKTLQ